MKAMTYSEFEEIVNEWFDRIEKENPGEIRLGQMYFNLLVRVKPAIARELRGSALDPFFKHRITEVLRTFVSEKWEDK